MNLNIVETLSILCLGVNGAGKTTQLQIITGQLEPDAGEVIKARHNMKIAHLTQEFDVVPSRTVRWASPTTTYAQAICADAQARRLTRRHTEPQITATAPPTAILRLRFSWLRADLEPCQRVHQ